MVCWVRAEKSFNFPMYKSMVIFKKSLICTLKISEIFSVCYGSIKKNPTIVDQVST